MLARFSEPLREFRAGVEEDLGQAVVEEDLGQAVVGGDVPELLVGRPAAATRCRRGRRPSRPLSSCVSLAKLTLDVRQSRLDLWVGCAVPRGWIVRAGVCAQLSDAPVRV